MNTLHFDGSQRDVTSVVISAHKTEVRVRNTGLGLFVTNAITNITQHDETLHIDVHPGNGVCAWRLRGPNTSIASNGGSIRIGGRQVGSDDGVPTVYLPTNVKIVETSGHVTDMRGYDPVANVGSKDMSWVAWLFFAVCMIVAIAVLWV